MSKKPIIEKQTPKAPPLDQLSQAQRERLSFIDFNLYFTGQMGRVDLATRFDVAPAVFTRDMLIYREYAPNNLVFNDKTKRYEATSTFKPVFEHDVQRVLFALSEGFGEGLNQASKGFLAAEVPLRLNQPDVSILAVVSRAIHQHGAVRLTYHSLKSGTSKREIVPFALVDSGQRWHVRCFDRKSQEFRDVVLTRVEKPTLIEGGVIAPHEHQEKDFQWSRIVEMELVPHPDHAYPEIVGRDCGLKDGRIIVPIRAAIAGYTLLQMGVDCSPDHSLDSSRYRLWLKNSDKLLYGVSSAVLAPGFKP